MKDGFVKVAAVTPDVRVADCDFNTGAIIASAERLASSGVKLAVFPELAVTAYTCGDLFLQETLIASAERALVCIAESTAGTETVLVVGCPIENAGRLYDCACVLYNGEILGAVPKTALSSAETRWFAFPSETLTEVRIGEGYVPFGTDILFSDVDMPAFTFAAEIGVDAFAPIPPSLFAAEAGATVIVNCAADCEMVDRARYRLESIRSQSARGVIGYIAAACGNGESTTDVIFAGQNIIAEDGEILEATKPFSGAEAVTELDVKLLVSERKRLGLYGEALPYRTVGFSMKKTDTALTRYVNPMPFIPEKDVDETCGLIVSMQSLALKRRFEHAHADKLVLGISGGLDSALALMVCVHTMEKLARPMSDIITVTMPCFGTTGRTKSNAELLCRSLGTDYREIPIFDSVRQHFTDIGHDIEKTDTTYENAQARERTQILMDIANMCNGLVVGTGDMSELALGWATYNGDHMSMYGVNASVPKTLVRFLASYEARISDDPGVSEALTGIVNTPISPELLPAQDDSITQKTEELVGPYELHDFFLYHVVRRGFAPAKIYRLARYAFDGRFTDAEIKKWLASFYRRFFIQQFKRSCLPDGVKIGSVDLSPRGEWIMPSDASFALWLAEAQAL